MTQHENRPFNSPPPEWQPARATAAFHLQRVTDATGVSGTGRVAEGVLFRKTGKCVVAWNTKVSSVAVYDSIAEVIAIHGHGGQTRVVFEGDDCPFCGHSIENHWGEGCGACMQYVGSREPHANCYCALVGRPRGWTTEGDLAREHASRSQAETDQAGRPHVHIDSGDFNSTR